MALIQVLVIPDTHVPYQDQRAYDLMLRVAADMQDGQGPDAIYLLGDFGDFYAASGHQKASNMERHLYHEVAAINEKLDELDEAWPKARKVFIQGNHEFRMERYIDSKAPELFGLVTCRDLFRIPQRSRWTWVDYTPDQLIQVEGSKLNARHEPLSGGNLPAYNTVVKAGCSIIYGHDHKSQSAQVVMANGDTHLGISVGWLGNAKHAAFNYVKAHHQWMHGFGSVTIDTSTGMFFVEAIRVVNYKCMANGVWYDG